MKPPTLAEQREALVHAWLGVRQRITPTQFRERIRGNERRVCAHVWAELRRIWEDYARTLATADARADAAKAARRWAALEAWARDESAGPALPELAEHDPTRGNTIPFEQFAGQPPPDDPDYPWGEWIDPDVKELDRLLEETDLGDKLRAAGWFETS